MINEMELVQTDIYSMDTAYRPSQAKQRSLGGAILLAAIADYRSTDAQEHKSAERFLYPRTRKWQEHYDWAVALTEGMNPAWLRDALDTFKDKWDGQRAERMARETRRALKSCLKLDRRIRRDGKLRIHSDGPLVPTERTRSLDPSFQPAGEACGARAGDAPQGL